MSRLDSTDSPRGVSVQKPKSDIWTVLLGISLTAILIAIICLCLEMSRYNWDIKAAMAPGATSTVVAAAPAFETAIL